MNLTRFATDKFRWVALVFLSLSLAIVIIDNTVLNVAVPYILRDLGTSLDAIQWVISGYALIMATLLITMGRLGDIYGRKKVLLIGLALFAIGSFIASIAPNAVTLFIGEALIEAFGASMMMTSTLSLLVSEFQGKERPIAFGVWGSVAGASAAVGPLLGGYLTTYFSWRWSLRINVFVAIVAILGAVFVKESRGEENSRFDWTGTIYSGLGLFSLVFALIEGRKYGWYTPKSAFSILGWSWPLPDISIVPFMFWLAALFLIIFAIHEYFLEKEGGSPLLRLSLFRSWGFSIGLVALIIISLGQFGAFFAMPIFLQDALGMNALQTGLVFLSASITMFIMGPISGFLAAKFKPKWVVTTGMFILALGLFLLIRSLSLSSTGWSLAPAFVVFGLGASMTAAQLTNVVLSAAPQRLAGEASAANSVVRQVGTTIGIAIMGTVLAATLTSELTQKISSDQTIPQQIKGRVSASLSETSIEGSGGKLPAAVPGPIADAIKKNVSESLLTASKAALWMAFYFVLAGAVVSFWIPNAGEAQEPAEERRFNYSEE